MKKILLTGSNGFIGSRINEVFSKKFNITRFDRNKIPVSNKMDVSEFVKSETPDYIINCAAIANPDYCELHPGEAYTANTEFVKNLAEGAAYTGSKFIQFSSAVVFSGNLKRPADENDEPDAVDVYGKTKIESEKIVRNLEKNIIIRISWQYTFLDEQFPNTNSLTHFIYNQVRKKKTITVNKNLFFNPTYILDTIDVLSELISEGAGIYHIASKTDLSADVIFKKIFHILKLNLKYLNIEDGPVIDQRLKSIRNIYIPPVSERLEPVLKKTSMKGRIKRFFKLN